MNEARVFKETLNDLEKMLFDEFQSLQTDRSVCYQGQTRKWLTVVDRFYSNEVEQFGDEMRLEWIKWDKAAIIFMWKLEDRQEHLRRNSLLQ